MSIKEIESLKAPAAFASILRDVEDGDLYVVTREGRPVAEIRSLSADPAGRAAQAAARIRELRKGNRLDGLTLKELRDEGRR